MTKKQTVTAIVPASELAKIRRNNAGIVAQANCLTIESAQTENDAYTVLRQIAKTKKAIKTRREEITKPLEKAKKSAIALFKELTEPLTDADEILRDKILAFHEEQEVIAEKKMATKVKIQESHEARGHEIHELAEVEADVGVSTVTKRWTFDIIKPTDVPCKYMVIDKVKVMASIHAGERDIPGLKIYQQTGLSIR